LLVAESTDLERNIGLFGRNGYSGRLAHTCRQPKDSRRDVAGEQMIGRLLVVWNASDHAAYHGELVRNCRGARKLIAEDIAVLSLHDSKRPAILRRCFRFRIKRVHVRKATAKMELYDTQGLFRRRIAFSLFCFCLQSKKITHGEPERAQKAHLDGGAARAHRSITGTADAGRMSMIGFHCLAWLGVKKRIRRAFECTSPSLG